MVLGTGADDISSLESGDRPTGEDRARRVKRWPRLKQQNIHVNHIFLLYFFSPYVSFSRLEYSAEQKKSAVAQSTPEGNVSHVWNLCLRHSQHPQCVLGCHGAAGIVCHHARYGACQ